MQSVFNVLHTIIWCLKQPGQLRRRGGDQTWLSNINNKIECRRRIGWDVSYWTRMSKADQVILLVGPSLPPNRALYFGFRPGSFRKWYLSNQLIFFAKKWSPMSLMVSSLRSLDEQGWRNGQTVSESLLHSCPLQQNWIQTFSGKSQGKILVIFMFGLLSQNIPISDWACFAVSLVTTWWCFFWRWTGDGFTPLSGVVVLCLSQADVQCALSPLEVISFDPDLLDWWGASGWVSLQVSLVPWV